MEKGTVSNIMIIEIKNQYKWAADLFDSDLDESELSDEFQSGDLSKALPRKHILSVEDEFLLTLMKLKPGLQNQDLAIRFQIAVSTVSKFFITWINLIYVKLGSLKVFPKREIIQANMTSDLKEKYPSTMLIIDCTEIKLQNSFFSTTSV